MLQALYSVVEPLKRMKLWALKPVPSEVKRGFADSGTLSVFPPPEAPTTKNKELQTVHESVFAASQLNMDWEMFFLVIWWRTGNLIVFFWIFYSLPRRLFMVLSISV